MYERAFGHELPGPIVDDVVQIQWPENTEYLREIFDRIGTRRPRGPEGPVGVPHAEVTASLTRQGLSLTTWEHDALDAMEIRWLAAIREVIAADRDRHDKR
jgi:hypothetical protein